MELVYCSYLTTPCKVEDIHLRKFFKSVLLYRNRPIVMKSWETNISGGQDVWWEWMNESRMYASSKLSNQSLPCPHFYNLLIHWMLILKTFSYKGSPIRISFTVIPRPKASERWVLQRKSLPNAGSLALYHLDVRCEKKSARPHELGCGILTSKIISYSCASPSLQKLRSMKGMILIQTALK